MILALADPAIVTLFCGEDVANVPDVEPATTPPDRVMPAFASAVH